MGIVQLLKTEYWSKADAFMLPLTGLSKYEKYGLRSYLFWRDYSIYDYNLVISFSHNDKDELQQVLKRYIFPVLDSRGYLTEAYDVGDKTMFILDMSEWAMDIQMFLDGKYSKFSAEARGAIEKFHTFNQYKIPVHVYAVLYPNRPMALLDNQTPIEYAAEAYGLDLLDMQKIGEIGSKYDKAAETLTIRQDVCHNSII